jgi:hypothetical protein
LGIDFLYDYKDIIMTLSVLALGEGNLMMLDFAVSIAPPFFE